MKGLSAPPWPSQHTHTLSNKALEMLGMSWESTIKGSTLLKLISVKRQRLVTISQIATKSRNLLEKHFQ